MRERWAAALEAAAREHWTPERLAALTGGKRLAVLPHEAAPLLRALGLVLEDGSMPPDKVRKYLQVNHLIRLLEPMLATLPGRVRILDAGCGRSYLTLAIAHVIGARASLLGVDRNAALIEECRRRAEIAQLADVARFEVGDVASVSEPADLVVALHACDTATCDAIALGIGSKAQAIAVAPCCQAELARAWTAAPGGAFAPVHTAPHLRREVAAHVTDAMRMLLMRAAGYEVSAAELVAGGHSPKNTLLRAVRTGTPNPAARAEYDALVAATGGAGLALAGRI